MHTSPKIELRLKDEGSFLLVSRKIYPSHKTVTFLFSIAASLFSKQITLTFQYYLQGFIFCWQNKMLHQCSRETSTKKGHCYVSESERDLFFKRFFKWHTDYVREENTDPVMLTYFVTYISQSRAESTSALQECWWPRKVCERGWGWVLD